MHPIIRLAVVFAFLSCALRAASAVVDQTQSVGWQAFSLAAAVSHLGLAIVFALSKEAM